MGRFSGATWVGFNTITRAFVNQRLTGKLERETDLKMLCPWL